MTIEEEFYAQIVGNPVCVAKPGSVRMFYEHVEIKHLPIRIVHVLDEAYAKCELDLNRLVIYYDRWQDIDVACVNRAIAAFQKWAPQREVTAAVECAHALALILDTAPELEEPIRRTVEGMRRTIFQAMT